MGSKLVSFMTLHMSHSLWFTNDPGKRHPRNYQYYSRAPSNSIFGAIDSSSMCSESDFNTKVSNQLFYQSGSCCSNKQAYWIIYQGQFSTKFSPFFGVSVSAAAAQWPVTGSTASRVPLVGDTLTTVGTGIPWCVGYYISIGGPKLDCPIWSTIFTYYSDALGRGKLPDTPYTIEFENWISNVENSK